MQRKGRTAFIVAFLAPAVLLYGLFVIWPLLESFHISLYHWSGLSAKKRFVGVQNYTDLVKDDVFWKSLTHNLLLLVFVGFAAIVLALLIAHAMQNGGRLGRILRSVYLFPQAISLVIVAVLWEFLFNPSMGLLSSALNTLGLGGWDHAWLGEPKTALPAVGVAFLWYIAGFYIMLFSAGLRNIPLEVNEAAELDGAMGLRRFWKVTWPMLWSIKRVAVVYVVINVMNLFVLVYLMTQGGPDRHTEVMLTYLYEKSFSNSQFGYGTALAVANFFIAMLLSGGIFFIFRKNPEGARV